jgi:hypothetical protein
VIKRHTPGDFIPLVWDIRGEEPPAYYVAGHVTDAAFRAALIAFHGEGFEIPCDAEIPQTFVRSVPAPAESDHDNEYRECVKGRGAMAVTVWTLEPHRGNRG